MIIDTRRSDKVALKEADVRNYAHRASMLEPSFHNRKFQREVGFVGEIPGCPLSYCFAASFQIARTLGFV